MLLGIVILFCFFVFIFFIYRVAKDDYVLIRKNFLLEHLMDFIFLGLMYGVIFNQIILLLYNFFINGSFSSIAFGNNNVGVSLTGLVISCLFCFFLLGKYRRLPVFRLIDFLLFSFSLVLTCWFLISIFLNFFRGYIYYLTPGIYYLIIFLIFFNFLYPRLRSNKLKEGSMSFLFLICFASERFLAYILLERRFVFNGLISEQTILIAVFFAGIYLLIRNERNKNMRRK